MLKSIGRYACLLLYCLYIFFCYHLLVLGAFADFSWLAFTIVPVVFLLFWLVPREQRKAAAVFTLMFIFFDQAVQRVRWMDWYWVVLNTLFIGLFVYPIVRWYAKLKLVPVLLALLTAFTLNLALPDRMAQGLAHLWPLAVTEPHYEGELSDPFPFTMADVNGDGKAEIITIGNTDIPPKKVQIGDHEFEIENEQFSLFVYEWAGGLRRIPPAELDAERVTAMVPQEYIGFPYYILTDSLRLEPLISRQLLTESMTQFGTSPYRSLLLNIENMTRLLDARGGVYDSVSQTGKFTDVILAQGLLRGSYAGQSFEVQSNATQVIGAIQLGGGREGLLVKGKHIHLYEMVDGGLEETHVLTRDMQTNLAQSSIMITDVNRNGIEELTIAFPYTVILEPAANGEWTVLWGTRERSFRVETVMNEGAENETLLAMSKSLVRASETNYLTGFSYSEAGLVRDWKVFMPGVVRVVTGDLDGDGKEEIATNRVGTHKIYVWTKHNVPVVEILIGLTVLLAAALAIWRWRWNYAK